MDRKEKAATNAAITTDYCTAKLQNYSEMTKYLPNNIVQIETPNDLLLALHHVFDAFPKCFESLLAYLFGISIEQFRASRERLTDLISSLHFREDNDFESWTMRHHPEVMSEYVNSKASHEYK